MEQLKCPKCGRKLDHLYEDTKIIERYTLTFNGKRYEGSDADTGFLMSGETIAYLCPYCSAELEQKKVEKVLK